MASVVRSYPHMKTTTFPLGNSMNRLHCPFAFLLILFALGCFALSPHARAACHEGCDHTRYNTFLGDGALGNNPAGYSDTATGAFALINNTATTRPPVFSRSLTTPPAVKTRPPALMR